MAQTLKLTCVDTNRHDGAGGPGCGQVSERALPWSMVEPDFCDHCGKRFGNQPAPKPEVEKVAVTQEDREAAADLLRDHNGGVYPTLWSLKAIRRGLDDGHPLVQAFARRRIAGLVEAKGIMEAKADEHARLQSEAAARRPGATDRFPHGPGHMAMSHGGLSGIYAELAAAIQARIEESKS